ncbi:MAG: hypothetical protein KDB79_11630, partial [Acidobacteria bacterium]|nr:hypothetical protein [Acidobacteriota bacterium]
VCFFCVKQTKSRTREKSGEVLEILISAIKNGDRLQPTAKASGAVWDTIKKLRARERAKDSFAVARSRASPYCLVFPVAFAAG